MKPDGGLSPGHNERQGPKGPHAAPEPPKWARSDGSQASRSRKQRACDRIGTGWTSRVGRGTWESKKEKEFLGLDSNLPRSCYLLIKPFKRQPSYLGIHRALYGRRTLPYMSAWAIVYESTATPQVF